MMQRNLADLPLLLACLTALLIAGCAATPPTAPAPPCPLCPPCPGIEPAKPAAKPLQPAEWRDLPGWESDDHTAVLELFRAQCTTLAKRPLWLATCDAAGKVGAGGTARSWFETHFRPWTLVNPDDSRQGLVTGYYEPIVRGSRTQQAPYLTPVFGPPADLIVVDLADLYPELKHMRLRGRIEGRKLVPYLDRAAWAAQETRRAGDALLWLDDPLDFFFLQIQGSGQVVLNDGSKVRIGYADQNGHPYRSIGKWLIERGELQSHEASMQGIKAWAAAHPERLPELLNANPSLVFFRELPIPQNGDGAMGNGPPGALGIPLTPERSIAVDPRHIPLGAPVWLSTTYPNSEQVLARTMLAQDTGGAIRGPVRADFYWGSGAEAGSQAGKMKQRGALWVLLPRDHQP
jgi:membrane-bound lytic murein transglycosylase A